MRRIGAITLAARLDIVGLIHQRKRQGAYLGIFDPLAFLGRILSGLMDQLGQVTECRMAWCPSSRSEGAWVMLRVARRVRGAVRVRVFGTYVPSTTSVTLHT